MSKTAEAADSEIVPPGAHLVSGHWLCRLLRHRAVDCTEDTQPTSTGGKRTRIVAACCTTCGRGQARVRVVYPPSRMIRVTPATSRSTRVEAVIEGGDR